VRSFAFLVLVVPPAVGGLTACGATEEPAAQEAAVKFLTEAASDPRAACGLLAPATAKSLEKDGDGECAKGLSQASLPPPSHVETVDVAGTSAQVKLSDQAVFLARFDDGWRIVAAGCARTSTDSAVPYDCDVED
jgi:hypothetical protein